MNVLVCGANGTLGSACVTAFAAAGYNVVPLGRDLSSLSRDASFDAVVWAQGQNAAGDIQDTSAADWASIWQANVGYIVDSLRALLDTGALASSARLVVISSVWQSLGRTDKVAYATTKAAVGGLVRALCADLGPRGIAINAVLPGVVDSPMTRQHLRASQIAGICEETPLGRLVSADEVAQTILFLASPAAAGISGQSITVDHGWSVTRHV
jgi:3-oxoacyl-[acyl-carrier protein] reductase